METNINSYIHTLVSQHIKPTDICLDATCGNGHDTVFLAKHAQHVFAIDIQDEAIANTTKLLTTTQLDNVTVIRGSHDQLDTLLPIGTKLHIVMYNLGYLPNSDHTVKTKADSTLLSIQQAIKYLEQGGLITIALYIGHEGGQDEANAIETYCTQLSKREFTIIKSTYLNRKHSPYIIIIQKD